jgi:signal transduction histidine kinase
MSHSIYWEIVIPIVFLVILCLGSFGLYTVNAVRDAQAIKFTPRNGKIMVETDYSDVEFTVHVKDTGIGISKEDLPHIFERFFKADKSRSQSGSGLGLAIAKHIILEHRGEIRVESQEGRGTTFSFNIPLRNS